MNGTSVTIGIQSTVGGIVDAINGPSTTTGVSAKVDTQTSVSVTGFVALTTAVASGFSTTLAINGVSIVLNSANSSGFAEFAATVNAFSNQTGVVVTGVASAYTFTNQSVGNIAISGTLLLMSSPQGVLMRYKTRLPAVRRPA